MLRKVGLVGVVVGAIAIVLPVAASAAGFSFAPAQTQLAGLNEQQMSGIATADVNGDGLPDAVVDGYDTGPGGAEPVIGVMLGRANGSLGPAANYEMAGSGALIGIATGDFNEDGSPDVVMGSAFGEFVVLSLNDGDGGFEPPTGLEAGSSPEGFVVGDFNGDGHLDIVSANGEDSYSVFLGHGDGSFDPSVTTPVGSFVMSIAGGDFNDDGKTDLAIGNIGESTVPILLGNGDGTFTETTPVDLSPLEPDPCGCIESWGIAAGDLNGDGRDDIVVSDRFENRLFSILSGPGGTFTPQGPFMTGNEGNPITVALGDLNADGNLDAVTADYGENTGTVLSGHGDGTFTSALEVDSGPSPEANAIADIDGDGKLDLLFADEDTNSLTGGLVTMLRNSGQPAALMGPAGGIDFGDQAQPTVSAPQAVTVTNEGDALLHVTGATLAGADAGDFLTSANDCTAAPVKSGASCTIAVRFIPSAGGGRSATLQVLSDSLATPAAIALKGNGTNLPAVSAGPAGAQGPAAPQDRKTPLVLVLVPKQLRATAGKWTQVSFATTQPGQATLTVRPGGRTIRRSLAAPGSRTLSLKIHKPGRYKLHLAFRASDGQQRSADAKLTVLPVSAGH